MRHGKRGPDGQNIETDKKKNQTVYTIVHVTGSVTSLSLSYLVVSCKPISGLTVTNMYVKMLLGLFRHCQFIIHYFVKIINNQRLSVAPVAKEPPKNV